MVMVIVMKMVMLIRMEITILLLIFFCHLIQRMSPEEQQKFRMDSCLGGTSEVVHKKAIQRYPHHG